MIHDDVEYVSGSPKGVLLSEQAVLGKEGEGGWELAQEICRPEPVLQGPEQRGFIVEERDFFLLGESETA